MWRAMQSALRREKKADEDEHRCVLHWGEPAEKQHMAPHAAPLQDSGCLCCATSASGTEMPAGMWPQLCPWRAPPVQCKGFEANVGLALTVQLSKIPQLWEGKASSRMDGCNYSPLASPSSPAAGC